MASAAVERKAGCADRRARRGGWRGGRRCRARGCARDGAGATARRSAAGETGRAHWAGGTRPAPHAPRPTPHPPRPTPTPTPHAPSPKPTPHALSPTPSPGRACTRACTRLRPLHPRPPGLGSALHPLHLRPPGARRPERPALHGARAELRWPLPGPRRRRRGGSCSQPRRDARRARQRVGRVLAGWRGWRSGWRPGWRATGRGA